MLRQPQAFFSGLSGSGDLVRIRLAGMSAYVPCRPDLVREVLVDDRTFDKGGPVMEQLRDIVGNGLATCPHDDHRQQRRLVQAAFRPARLADYARLMSEEIGALAESWQPNRVVDVYPALHGLALRISVRTLFSAADPRLLEQLRQAMESVMADMLVLLLLPAPLRRLPVGASSRYRRELRRIHDAVAAIVTQYRSDDVDHGDLLSLLLGLGADDRDDPGAGRALSDPEIHDQAMTIMVGAAETVAASLSWALYFLSQDPSVATRLHRELDAVLDGRAARPEDVAALPYTRRVITESLRLHPPGWLVSRTTTRPTELAGQELPTGTTILLSPLTAHRNPAVFDRPDSFDPDRWLPERAAALPRGAFVAFGGGARKCVGDDYGMTEAVLTLATVLSRRTLTPAPGCDPRPARALVNHPRRLLMTVQERGRAQPFPHHRGRLPRHDAP